jgi:CheY-like chemotaxis protein
MSAEILIVEDDPIILMSQQEIVSSLGYEVMATARSGEVAIELVR